MGGKRGRGRTDFKFCVQTICGLKQNVQSFKSVAQFLDFMPKKSNSGPQCSVQFFI